MSILDNQPISTVKWLLRENLKPNNYNPNHVAPVELDLLEVSILTSGWTQPIVITDDNVIIDGYHRWLISERETMQEKFNGYVPTVIMLNLEKGNIIASTVRHNRARGSHSVLKMSELIKLITNENYKEEDILKYLGMDIEEYKRFLLNEGIKYSEVVKNSKYSKAWLPFFKDDNSELFQIEKNKLENKLENNGRETIG